MQPCERVCEDHLFTHTHTHTRVRPFLITATFPSPAFYTRSNDAGQRRCCVRKKWSLPHLRPRCPLMYKSTEVHQEPQPSCQLWHRCPLVRTISQSLPVLLSDDPVSLRSLLSRGAFSALLHIQPQLIPTLCVSVCV